MASVKNLKQPEEQRESQCVGHCGGGGDWLERKAGNRPYGALQVMKRSLANVLTIIRSY